MPNAFGTFQAAQNQGGYVANPFAPGNATMASQTPQTFASATAMQVGGKQQENPLITLGSSIAAAPVDIVDSMAALFPGMQRGDVNDAVYDAIGQPNFGRWVRDNKDSVEVVSGLAGSVIVGAGAEIVAAKFISSAWLGATGLGRAAQPLIQMTSRASVRAADEAMMAAARGETLGVWQGANLALIGAKSLEFTAKAAVGELAIAATMNKNTAIWSDDMSQNLMWGALGLGIGGGLGAISGRGMVYRWANSDEVRYTRAEVADPTGFERMRTAEWNPVAGLTGLSGTGMVTLRESAEITNLALDSRSLDTGVSGPRNQGTIGSQIRANVRATQDVGMLQRKLQAWTRKGSEGVAESQFNLKTPAGNHIEQALHDDPTVFLAADSLAEVKPNRNVLTLLAERQKHIDTLLETPDIDVIDKGLALEKQIPLVLVNKQWMTPKDAAPILEFTPNPDSFTNPGSGILETHWKSGYSGKVYKINESGALNVDLEGAPIQDVIGLYEAANRQLELLRGKKTRVTLPDKPSYFALDFAVEYEKRGGEVDWKKFAKLDGAESAQVKSLALKAEAIEKGGKRVLSAHERMLLNLPMQNSYERLLDPDGANLASWVKAAQQPNVDIATMRKLRSQVQQTLDLVSDVKNVEATDGGMFVFNRDSAKPSGTMHPGIIGFFTEPDVAKFHKFVLSDSIQEGKTWRYSVLSSTKTAPLASSLTGSILNHPMIKQAMDITGLHDSQLAGTLGTVSASASQFLTQAMRFRNIPALQAAQDIRRVVGRTIESTIDQAYEALAPINAKLNAITGAQSKALWQQFLSNSAGWDIAATRMNPDGMVEFVLKQDSAKNAERLGRAVTKGEVLTNPKTGKPIVLDGLAEQARKSLQKITKQIRHEENAVRLARGQSPIGYDPFWVPPASTDGKFVALTLDAANRSVPGGAIVAKTAKELESLIKARSAKLPAGHKFKTLEEIEAYTDLWDQAQMGFIDPTSMAAPSGVNRGALAGADVNPNAIADTLAYIKRAYEQIGNGVVRTVFDSQLGVAQMRSAAQSETLKSVPGAKDIWTTYQETLLGLPAGVNPRGLSGMAKQLDTVLDNVIAAAWTKTPVPRNFLRGVLDVIGWRDSSVRGKPLDLKTVKSFNDLQTKLAPYMPFTDAMDYAQYVHGIKLPPTMKEVSRGLNRLGSGIILRWGEIPHAAMNMAGIITNMSGLVSNKNVPIIGKVGGVPVVDSMKIMSKGFQRMLSERSSEDWAEMVKNGDVTQDVAELHTQLSLVKNKNSFMKIMTGDPAYAKWDKLKGAARSQAFLKYKGVEGMASIMADTSESASRRWAHFVGLELADHYGVVGLEARHTFARNIANDAIANYDPLNRPEIFNSGVGSMYGLFLSYAQNYYQRMFRWLEAEDYAAVGKSLTAQAAMFGFAGVPGFNQLAALIGGEEDGTGLLDGIYERFGAATGNVIAHGGFNQVVSLLSLGTLPGIAFHTRGDANFRHPAGDFLAAGGKLPVPVGIEVVSDIVQASFKVLDGLVNHRDIMSGRYAAEIMARQMPSRMLHGALTVLAAQGDDVDVNGNLMSETKSGAESVYRFLGLRSTRQQSEIDAYFMNQKALAIDAARMAPLREKTRSLVREGKYDALPAVFDNYIDAGGKPWNYAGWIQSIVKEAQNTRTQNQLLKSLRGPSHRDLARRIELYTGGV